jgi:hypothetical protein
MADWSIDECESFEQSVFFIEIVSFFGMVFVAGTFAIARPREEALRSD